MAYAAAVFAVLADGGCAGHAAAAPAMRGSRPSAAAEIDALGGAMPHGFDLYLGDPCFGPWDILAADGTIGMKITVYRYRGLLLMNVSGPGIGSSNHDLVRLDPHAVRASVANGASIVLRCGGDRAALTIGGPGQRPTVFNARVGMPAPPSPRTPTPPAAPATPRGSVRVEGGEIVYVDAGGAARPLTRGGGYREPVLAPDGRTVALIHLDSDPDDDNPEGRTSLWLVDAVTGASRKLIESIPDDDARRNLAAFGNPRFSLDGGFVYVDAEAWPTSTAIHQVNVTTGAERYVAAGWTTGVIRSGPYRGFLIVGQHRYHEPPQLGAYNPLSVMRPDGTPVLMIPGTDRDGLEDDGQAAQAAWLRGHGWTAW